MKLIILTSHNSKNLLYWDSSEKCFSETRPKTSHTYFDFEKAKKLYNHLDLEGSELYFKEIL